MQLSLCGENETQPTNIVAAEGETSFVSLRGRVRPGIGHFVQSSSANPGTFPKSRVLRVNTVNPRLKAMDAMRRSMVGIRGNVLPEILDPAVPTTFWLDGHIGIEEDERGDKACPLLDELRIIQKLDWIESPVIIIDDAQLLLDSYWSKYPDAHPDCKHYHLRRADWPSLTEVLKYPPLEKGLMKYELVDLAPTAEALPDARLYIVPEAW